MYEILETYKCWHYIFYYTFNSGTLKPVNIWKSRKYVWIHKYMQVKKKILKIVLLNINVWILCYLLLFTEYIQCIIFNLHFIYWCWVYILWPCHYIFNCSLEICGWYVPHLHFLVVPWNCCWILLCLMFAVIILLMHWLNRIVFHLSLCIFHIKSTHFIYIFTCMLCVKKLNIYSVIVPTPREY